MEQVLVRSGSVLWHEDATGETGLNQLQIWQARGGEVLTLFAVSNPAEAERWLSEQKTLGHVTSYEFLTTK